MATAERRYLSLVVKRQGCWSWSGSKSAGGYGTFGHGGKAYTAHRFSYALHNGPIRPGALVRHTCHNAECSNPAHLILGDNRLNRRDRSEKEAAQKTLHARLAVILFERLHAVTNATPHELESRLSEARDCVRLYAKWF